MSKLKEVLKAGLGEDLVHSYPKREGDKVDLLQIDLQLKSPVTVIMTDGLSEHKMTIPDLYNKREEYAGRHYTELFFCLPEYWDLNDTENPNMQWPLDIIQKLATGLLEHNAWYGAGHSIANGKPPLEISETMKEKYFLLMDPILLDDYFPTMHIEDREVNFLAIVPIFEKEFVKKNKRGYKKWRKFFIKRYGNEMLDDYRRNVHKRYWEFY